VPKWFFIYNHLHAVHAIASCNAAEMAMGMLLEADQSPVDPQGDERGLPREGHYLAAGQARLELPDFASITDGTAVVVPVTVVDRNGTEVVRADITCWVTAVR